MSADRKLDALSRVPLFSACTPRELRRIAQLATEATFVPGEVLTREGRPGTEAFVIAEGTAAVTLRAEPLGTVGPGDIVGEMALLAPEPRAATVTAETAIRAYVIGAGEFGSLLDEVPIVSRRILQAVAGRLREVEHAPSY